MVREAGLDLPCGAGRAAALRRPRRLIHSRSRSTPQNNQNKQPTLTGGLPVLVEMRGVEPLSESTLTGTSPGADGCLRSLARAGAVTLGDSVAS